MKSCIGSKWCTKTRIYKDPPVCMWVISGCLWPSHASSINSTYITMNSMIYAEKVHPNPIVWRKTMPQTAEIQSVGKKSQLWEMKPSISKRSQETDGYLILGPAKTLETPVDREDIEKGWFTFIHLNIPTGNPRFWATLKKYIYIYINNMCFFLALASWFKPCPLGSPKRLEVTNVNVSKRSPGITSKTGRFLVAFGIHAMAYTVKHRRNLGKPLVKVEALVSYM